MKLHDLFEITDSEKEIKRLLKQFFVISEIRGRRPKISINNDKASVDGFVYLKGTPSVDTSGYSKGGIDRLPVKFDKVTQAFSMMDNALTTLEGCPTHVGLDFHCDQNNLKSLIGGPIEVGGGYYCSQNPLTSLEGLPQSVNHTLSLPYSKDLPLLRVLFVKNVSEVTLWSDAKEEMDVESIINKYLHQGQGGALACAAELNRAGFRGNARR